jgi:uncharacterized protein (DUF1697 family)
MMARSGTEEAARRHVAFLRGINVGGRRVTKTQLCSPFEALGFEEVGTFLASGNVTFAAADAEALEPRIEAALRTALGFEVETFVRTVDQLAQVVAFEPFPAAVVDATDGKLQVTFLRDEPNPAAVAEAMTHASEQDRLAVAGREWYWLPAAGISTSALDVRAVERALGRGTTRTLNTVSRLHARLTPELRG